MKTFTSVVSLSVGLMAFSASAAQPVPTGTPLNTQQEVGAQVNVIRDTIEDALRKLDERRPDTKFKMKDYWQQLPEFKKKVATSMDNFRRTLGDSQQGILGRLALAMDRYNSIYESNSFSPEQKKILLEGALTHLRVQEKVITRQYHDAIGRAFTDVFGKLPLRARVEVLAHWDNNIDSTNRSSKKAGCSLRKKYYQDSRIRIRLENLTHDGKTVFDECLKYWKSIPSNEYNWGESSSFEGIYYEALQHDVGWIGKPILKIDYVKTNVKTDDSFPLAHYLGENAPLPVFEYVAYPIGDDIYADAYKSMIYPTIKEGCKSEICLGLRSGDLVFTLQLLESALNRDIYVELLGKTYVKLPQLPVRFDEIIKQLGKSKNPENLPYDTE